MKILSFSYCFPNRVNPNWGVFVYQRLAALAKINELRVCSPVPWFPVLSSFNGNPGPLEDNWGNVQVYRPRFFYLPRIMKDYDARFYARGTRPWLRKVCETWKPDVLDAHFIWPDGVAVALLAREMKMPYVITLRGKLYECLPFRAQRIQCKKALEHASAVVSVSGHLASEAVKLGARKTSTYVIPNGIDPGLFKPMDQKDARMLLGLPKDGKILVTVAHLGHRKGHYEAIEALAGLPRDVFLVIVGGEAQGGTFDQLKAAASRHGVSERVILPGPQPYKKVPLYFNAADAGLLASYREGCPNAVLECLACGRPMIATDVGAVRDILPAPHAGRIVPVKDVAALRRAMHEVLSRQWDREEILRVSQVRSWDEVALKVQEILEMAAGRSGS